MKTIPNDGTETIYLVKLSLISLFIIIIEWWAGFYNIITTIDIIISLYPCLLLTKWFNRNILCISEIQGFVRIAFKAGAIFKY